MELQNIRENRQAAQRRRIEFTSLEQEIIDDRESWLERVNVHLEGLLDKAERQSIVETHGFPLHGAKQSVQGPN